MASLAARPSPATLTSPTSVLLAVFTAAAVVGTEPLGELVPYAFYLPMACLFVLQMERAFWPAVRRLSRIAPLLVLLALGLPASRFLDGIFGAVAQSDARADWLAGASLFLRALCAVTLVSALVHGCGFARVLSALRRLGLPAAVLLTLEYLERYRTLIAEEWRRTNIARDSRAPGGMRFAFGSYANQAGMVFLRSWDRGERIHAAMLARGFEFDAKRRREPGAPVQAGWRTALDVLWLPIVALAIRLAV